MSKTLAEKATWEFAEKHGLNVVAIHPATCLGPLLQPYLNASCAVLQQLLQGSKDTQEYHWLGAVHVKDVAKAQVLLFESPAASGRYLCTNGIYQFADFADRVSKLFPEFPVYRFGPPHPQAKYYGLCRFISLRCFMRQLWLLSFPIIGKTYYNQILFISMASKKCNYVNPKTDLIINVYIWPISTFLIFFQIMIKQSLLL